MREYDSLSPLAGYVLFCHLIFINSLMNPPVLLIFPHFQLLSDNLKTGDNLFKSWINEGIR